MQEDALFKDELEKNTPEDKNSEEVSEKEASLNEEIQESNTINESEKEVIEKKKPKKEKERKEKSTEEKVSKKEIKQDVNKDDKKKKISKAAKRRRLLIFIITAYIDLLLIWVVLQKKYLSVLLSGGSLSDDKDFASSVLVFSILIIGNIISISFFRDAKKLKDEKDDGLLQMLDETESIDGREIIQEEFDFTENSQAPVYRNTKQIEAIDMHKKYIEFIAMCQENGIIIDKKSAREILSAIASCRMIFIKEKDENLRQALLMTITEFFGVDFYLSDLRNVKGDKDRLDSIVWEQAGNGFITTDFSKGILASRNFMDKVNIAMLNNVNPAEMKYFKEIFQYCKNPDVPCSLRIGSRNVDNGYRSLPKNLWFILGVDNEAFDAVVSSEVAKYSYMVETNLKVNEENVEAKEHKSVSYPQLLDRISEQYEDNFIPEDVWKKLDDFEEYLAKRGNYFIDNRIIREMERYASIYLSCEGELVDLIDTLLAKKLLMIALPNEYKYLENDEESLVGMAEKILGADYLASSQAILKKIKIS